MKYGFRYFSTIGLLTIIESEGLITNIFFENQKIDFDFILKETELIKKCFSMIKHYLTREIREFDLSIFKIDDFYAKLLQIPYGNTISYQEFAEMHQKEKAVRSIASLIGKNKLPIILPCHRVILKNGKIGNFSGGNLLKEKLLNIEGVNMLKLNK